MKLSSLAALLSALSEIVTASEEHDGSIHVALKTGGYLVIGRVNGPLEADQYESAEAFENGVRPIRTLNLSPDAEADKADAKWLAGIVRTIRKATPWFESAAGSPYDHAALALERLVKERDALARVVQFLAPFGKHQDRVSFGALMPADDINTDETETLAKAIRTAMEARTK